MREALIAKAHSLLSSQGFSITSFFEGHSCFDLAARKGNITILLKVFDNIDALREEQALELRKMATLFKAVAIVLGNKSKAFGLKTGVIYERYGLPVVSIGCLQDMLGKNLPDVKYFKGREIVELNNELLRERRKELGLTLSDLAEKVDSSVESMHRYEKGHTASLQMAEKLERALDARLVKEIDLLSGKWEEDSEKKVFDEELQDSALEKVHDLGVDLAIFKHAPFKAGSISRQPIAISKARTKHDLGRKAIELSKTRHVFDSRGMLITEKTKIRAVRHVPVVEEEELSTLGKFQDLLELLKEREKMKNG